MIIHLSLIESGQSVFVLPTVSDEHRFVVYCFMIELSTSSVKRKSACGIHSTSDLFFSVGSDSVPDFCQSLKMGRSVAWQFSLLCIVTDPRPLKTILNSTELRVTFQSFMNRINNSMDLQLHNCLLDITDPHADWVWPTSLPLDPLNKFAFLKPWEWLMWCF